MDIDFIVQDTFSLTRPQWSFAADFEEAGRAFAELVKQNYKAQEQEKPVELEEPDDGVSSEDEADEDDLPVPEMDAQSSRTLSSRVTRRSGTPKLKLNLTGSLPR